MGAALLVYPFLQMLSFFFRFEVVMKFLSTPEPTSADFPLSLSFRSSSYSASRFVLLSTRQAGGSRQTSEDKGEGEKRSSACKEANGHASVSDPPLCPIGCRRYAGVKTVLGGGGSATPAENKKGRRRLSPGKSSSHNFPARQENKKKRLNFCGGLTLSLSLSLVFWQVAPRSSCAIGQTASRHSRCRKSFGERERNR